MMCVLRSAIGRMFLLSLYLNYIKSEDGGGGGSDASGVRKANEEFSSSHDGYYLDSLNEVGFGTG